MSLSEIKFSVFETLHEEHVIAVREEPILHHIDSVDVSFNKRVMGVGLSRWCVGVNVYVFATDINVFNGEVQCTIDYISPTV